MDTESWTGSSKSGKDGHGVLDPESEKQQMLTWCESAWNVEATTNVGGRRGVPEGEDYDPLDLRSNCAYDGAMASVVRRLSQDWALCVSLRAIRSDWDFILSHEADMSPSGRDTVQDPNAHTCTQGMTANSRCRLRDTAGITMYEGNLCSDASGI
ncbi:hypothetical protein CDL15_Pgr014942 [Punica granatum]|uniref:Uncharacterized protein n=1 Tax=Punica granatum TaxID=22663 RepID=A0A218WZM7_PUNGR|nr:hypothetical protein CDL15_Pgr014942 [Punica granatum]